MNSDAVRLQSRCATAFRLGKIGTHFAEFSRSLEGARRRGTVVFVTTYMMDIRHIGASGKCRTEDFAEAGAELPPGASVGVNAFAWPDMLLEIAATAAVEK